MLPVWSSGFRPFFLASAVYGPAVMALTAGNYLAPGVAALAAAQAANWHAHELLCGWAGALIGGFLLTALPSWAGVNAVAGAPLVFVFLAWAFGRAAMWAQSLLPGALTAVLDLAFFPALALALAPGVWRAGQKRYRAVLVILSALFIANLLYHLGVLQGDAAAARFGLALFLGVLTFLFSVVAGFLTPVFTEGALRNAGFAVSIPFNVPLEIAAAVSMAAFLAATLGGQGALPVGVAGSATLLLHGARVARWYRPGILELPLVWVLHLAYGWLWLSVLLRVASEFSAAVPAGASIHAFTVGALSLMQLGLLSRVTLRHTGRAVVAPRLIRYAIMFMLAAAVLRVLAVFVPARLLIVAAAVFWIAPAMLYLLCQGRMLLAPSLPKSPA